MALARLPLCVLLASTAIALIESARTPIGITLRNEPKIGPKTAEVRLLAGGQTVFGVVLWKHGPGRRS